MPHCAAIGCAHKSSSRSKAQLELEKHKKITFHCFPKNTNKRKVWIDRMGLTEASLPKYPHLCSCHFSSQSFDRTSACKIRLKDNAVPSISKVHYDVSNTVTNQDAAVLQDISSIDIDKETMKLKRTAEDEAISMDEVEESTTKKLKQENVNTIEEKIELKRSRPDEALTDNVVKKQTRKKLRIVNSPKDYSTKDASSQTPSQPQFVDKATWVSKSLANSPTKTHLRSIIKNKKISYEREIRLLKQKTRRKEKRIASLKNVLTELQKHTQLTDNELDVLRNIGTSTKDLLKRVTKKSEHAVVPKKFTPELRSFALTLHYYSPRAYHYVRQKFDSCLPHAKTLSKWYRSVNGQPGFNTESLNAIKERANTTDHLLVGSLVFDEMAIRQHIEYDGKEFSGYEDLGSNIASDSQTVAKDALVFLFVCMNSSWKIPVAFFLTGGVNANQKATLVNQCLTLLQESGVKVISVTFDGASANISIAKQLGCRLDNPNALQPWFLHPVTSEKVYIIPDPCHMIKLIRNTLGDPKLIIMNGNGDSILWKYIKKIHEIQEREGLHLGNKLRSRHIDFYKHKMKVKFATQVLSTSLAKSIELCRTNLQLDYFEKSAATEEFLQIFNDLFDILNSKNLSQTGLKKPIHSENKAEVLAKLDECRDYILGLKEFNTGRSILNTQRKMGFLGFLICIESLQGIFYELCENTKVLTHIPAYKLSQDHVKLFFGCLRSHGGHNNNPTVRQFKAILKKLLIHSEIRDTDSGNCIPLENIAILHVTSARKPEDIINSSTSTARLIGNDPILNLNDTGNVLDDHSYLPDIRTVSEFSDRIIVYIAGFVVKHLSKTLIWETCVDALSGSESDPESALISLKSRGGLHYPSYSVQRICRTAEEVIRFALKESGGKFLKKKFTGDYLLTCILSSLSETSTLFFELRDHCHDQIGLRKPFCSLDISDCP